jgi:hypothetical protein
MRVFVSFFFTALLFGCAHYDYLVKKTYSPYKGGTIEWNNDGESPGHAQALARAGEFCSGPYEILNESRSVEGFLVRRSSDFKCK